MWGFGPILFGRLMFKNNIGLQGKNWVGLDTETTGISFLTSQVIQVGAVFCDEDLNTLHQQEWNINFKSDDPRYVWTKGAQDVHGITQEQATVHGLDDLEFIIEFQETLKSIYGSNYKVKDTFSVGAQSYFDFVMLQNSLYEPNNKNFPLSYRQLGDITCLGNAATGITGLDKQLKNYGIVTDNSKRHSALYDADCHMQLFKSIVSHSG
jgi:DNA polymerase III epsilon subunit-like protein